QRPQTAGLSAAGPAGKCRTEKPLLPRLANSLQIDHGPNPIKAFYQQSRLRTGSVRHARLNTQRKILEAMWLIWLRCRPFDPNKFAQTQPAALKEQAAVESKGSKPK